MDSSPNKHWLSIPTTKLILIFCLVDLLAIFCAWLWANDIFLETRFFRLDRDRGFSEILQYIKTGFVITLLLAGFRDVREEVLRAWLILFWVILLDDMAGLHEALGEFFVEAFAIPSLFGIDPQAIAEIAAFALMEGTALLYVLYCTLKAQVEWQRFSIIFLIVFSPLILSGVVLDATGVRHIESLGEILSMSLILGFAHIRLKAYLTAK